ncbi:hypothetical protein CONPUDRAFT_155337 [Coniophora puteana RWD-64-598 SS2]|uniref:Nephrocystin 3-like N-terminal domain-containing protein n=1 Tax=Coniophora puteana (strain RWD-64-598) TaxID=741705 RepID=A0A5M3MLN4_CONPW|nr:uncharacterized protein CONPUDRAFT_155337 [Coniophora puteana RWD-64-598 SS2]EIW79947.1 hypothetical protein CONPUDRAFT_155337 [Coniophora puteana RWD-64-598 SS2]
MSTGVASTWKELYNATAKAAEYNANERRNFSRCLPGTRTELLNDLQDDFGQDGRKIVWLFGDSGTGKSSVAHTIAQRLKEQDRLAATFFFSRKQRGRSNPNQVLSTIAYQIGCLHRRAKEAIVRAIEDDPGLLDDDHPRDDQFRKLVQEPLRNLKSSWTEARSIIIDAADEAEPPQPWFTRSAIVPMVLTLNDLLRDHNVPISRILITSRPLPLYLGLQENEDVRDFMYPIHIEDFDATPDIELYLRESFNSIHACRQLHFVRQRPWPTQDILASLSSHVHGRFITAATIVRWVEAAEHPVDCLNLVSNLYNGRVDTIDIDLRSFDSLYHYILCQGTEDDLTQQRAGAELLSDIAALAQPLSASTISILLGIDVRKQTARLAAIINVPPLDPVQIYHPSLRDYLADESRSQYLYIQPCDSHNRLTQWCFRTFRSTLPDHPRDVSPALQYALDYWTFHLLHSGQTPEANGTEYGGHEIPE